jgi:CRP-like cAMP-binding protein
MPPTVEARTADRAIACLRKAIEELAAGRPRAAMAMVTDAEGSVLALRSMIEGQISHDELETSQHTTHERCR